MAQPLLSPRLHSLPDNQLSPLGLLAAASLQDTDATTKKRLVNQAVASHTGKSMHKPSPLGMGMSIGRNGSPSSPLGSS